jgi:hypothetical protein
MGQPMRTSVGMTRSLAASLFRPVHGLIGGLQQTISGGQRVHDESDPDADADRNVLANDLKWLGECGDNPISNNVRRSGVNDTDKDNCKFIAAKAGDCVPGSRPPSEARPPLHVRAYH